MPEARLLAWGYQCPPTCQATALHNWLRAGALQWDCAAVPRSLLTGCLVHSMAISFTGSHDCWENEMRVHVTPSAHGLAGRRCSGNTCIVIPVTGHGRGGGVRCYQTSPRGAHLGPALCIQRALDSNREVSKSPSLMKTDISGLRT